MYLHILTYISSRPGIKYALTKGNPYTFVIVFGVFFVWLSYKTLRDFKPSHSELQNQIIF